MSDPTVGRFTSQDSFLGSIDNPPSLHRYFYANANPTRYVDPTGHFALDLESLKKGYETAKSTVVSVAQSAYGSYQTAKQQVIARQGADIQDALGMRELAIAGQMLRNAEQSRVTQTAGAPGSVANAAIQGFQTEAAASILEMPSNMMAGLSNLALPGGVGMWQGREPTQAELAYAPARQQQVSGLRAAMDSSLPMAERAAHGFAAVATTPVVIVEGLTWGAGGRASDAVGKEIQKAEAAPTRTDAVFHGLQAGQEFLTAFSAYGSMVAPFTAKGAAPSSAAAELKPGQIASAYPKGRPVAGGRAGRLSSDPPAGFREQGAFEWTPQNVARMERGQPPIGTNGRPVQLHHRGQSPAGPLDELTSTTHESVSHPVRPSQIDRAKFAGERSRYWASRVREALGQ